MSRIRTAGLGVAVALSAASVAADDGFSSRAPVARLVGVRPAGPARPTVTARGQFGEGLPMPTPMPLGAGVPTDGGVLGTPRAMGGPSVTELRTPPPPTAPNFGGYPVPGSYPAPPAGPQGYGQPMILGTGQPVPVGQPFVIGGPPPAAGPVYPSGPTYPGGPPVFAGPPAGAFPGLMAGPPPAAAGMPAPVLDDPLFAGVGPAAGFYAGPGRGRLSITGELLLWWVPNFHLPTLLTTSSPAFNGIPGQGNTQSVYGAKSTQDALHTGARFAATYWFGPREVWGVQGDVFFLGTKDASTTIDSNQFPVLARPFFDVNTNQPFSELVASPGVSVGAAKIATSTNVWGAGANFVRKIGCSDCATFELLTGFRYLRLADSLTVNEQFIGEPGAPRAPGGPAVQFGSVVDSFKTTNQFFGYNAGAQAGITRGRWSLNGHASIAIGNTYEVADIGGGQSLVTSAGPAVAAGGLLALPGGNLGRFTQNKFAVLPEVGLQVGYNVTPRLRLGVGYNLLYLSNVIRPGDQIDTGLDVTRIPNFPVRPAQSPLLYPNVRPVPTFRQTDLLINGISFSATYRF